LSTAVAALGLPKMKIGVDVDQRWYFGEKYKRTSISGTKKKAQITFPLRHFFPLKVVE
jgi:hypothetical protein